MESEKVEYLRKRFRESPSSEKKISDIKDDPISQFPSASWNARIVSQTVRAAFPRSESKQHGRSHSQYIHGIEENEIQATDHAGIMSLLEAERMKNRDLLSRVQHLEQENADLRSVVLQPAVLESQLQQVMNPAHPVYHGPDTVAHFDSFSIDCISACTARMCFDYSILLEPLTDAMIPLALKSHS